MDRREFIKRSVILGLGIGYAMLPNSAQSVFADETKSTGDKPDLVAIKGDDPAKMFDSGIKALGGMQQFVKKGQKVLVKPNIGWAVKPEYAANTNPLLVKRVVEHCFNAGAEEVYVFDHSCDHWKLCYNISGIPEAAREAGAKVVPPNGGDFEEVRIPGAKVLKKTQVHHLVLDCDVFINIPVLKSHHATQVTIALKNLMGVVLDRMKYHNTGLNDCITDFCFYRKPDLNIVDAYRVMLKYGPKGFVGNGVTKAKTQLISRDIVAIDAAATKVFGLEPEKVRHIKLAAEKKLGEINLKNIRIKKITL